MRSYADVAPPVLLDPDGEGVYVRARPEDRCLPQATVLLGLAWQEIEMAAVSLIPGDGEDWRAVGFRNWRWRLWPLSREPATFLFCTPATEAADRSTLQAKDEGGGEAEELANPPKSSNPEDH